MRQITTLLCFLLTGILIPLSAQSFRLQLDGGVAGLENNQSTGPAATLGGEFIFPLAPKTFFTSGVDLAYVALTSRTPGAPPFVISGPFTIRYESSETYRLRRTEVGLSLGVEQHAGRLRVQLLSRLSHYFVNNIRYNSLLDFEDPSRPDKTFVVEVTEGELFEQDVQTNRIDVSTDYQVQAGASVRYDVGKGFELGFTGFRTLNSVALERYVTRFCPDCPEIANPSVTSAVEIGTWQVQLSTRYVF